VKSEPLEDLKTWNAALEEILAFFLKKKFASSWKSLQKQKTQFKILFNYKDNNKNFLNINCRIKHENWLQEIHSK